MSNYEAWPLAKKVSIGSTTVSIDSLPAGYEAMHGIGIAGHASIAGSVVYRTESGSLFEPRCIVTPGGDYLLMFPTNTRDKSDGRSHYGSQPEKVNDLVAMRSEDRGKSWSGPTRPIDIDYNQHGFIPLVPRLSSVNPGKRIYCFGTQPIWANRTLERGLQENAPIGYRYSDDDGFHWVETRLIRPVNDPEFTGMSVMRMCETASGAWLLGSHEADWSYKPLMTRQYILRSEDEGASWELVPGVRHGGWYVPGNNRMDEGRPIALADGRVLLMIRTPEGHLWQSWSEDDGKNWSAPEASSLVHPDAPPMLFHLSDGKTLVAFHHNRFHDRDYTGLSGTKPEVMQDRSEIWVSRSTNGGESWSEPRFLYATAVEPRFETPFFNYQCSYMDMFLDGSTVNLIVPHLWHQVLHLRIEEGELDGLSTASEMGIKIRAGV